MKKKYGMNLEKNGVRIIDIAPVFLSGCLWYCVGFEDIKINMGDYFHLALVHSKYFSKNDNNLVRQIQSEMSKGSPLLRIHSECILGDNLYSSLCDCGDQLHKSIQLMTNDGAGIVLYLRQEGRGIGLRAKLAVLALQEGYVGGKLIHNKCGPDEANIRCGFRIDERDYQIVPKILSCLHVRSVRVITGNPEKIEIIKSSKIKVKKIVDIPIEKNFTRRQALELREKLNRRYYYPAMDMYKIKTKEDRWKKLP